MTALTTAAFKEIVNQLKEVPCIDEEVSEEFEAYIQSEEQVSNNWLAAFIDEFLNPDCAASFFDKLLENGFIKYGDSKASVPETKTNTYLTTGDKPLYIVVTIDVNEGTAIECFEDKRAYKKYYSQLKPNSKSWNE